MLRGELITASHLGEAWITRALGSPGVGVRRRLPAWSGANLLGGVNASS